jgi:hypothetical protein
MYVRVEVRDDKRRVVIGRLDNERLNDYGGKIELGSPWSSATPRFESIARQPKSENSDLKLYPGEELRQDIRVTRMTQLQGR